MAQEIKPATALTDAELFGRYCGNESPDTELFNPDAMEDVLVLKKWIAFIMARHYPNDAPHVDEIAWRLIKWFKSKVETARQHMGENE